MSCTFPSFFFQAEDGIRDVAVTGVQTCALPISTFTLAPIADGGEGFAEAMCVALGGSWIKRTAKDPLERDVPCRYRSEERRVGKECRSRWAGDQEDKHRVRERRLRRPKRRAREL